MVLTGQGDQNRRARIVNTLEITQSVSASAVSAKIGKTIGKFFMSKKTRKGRSTGWQVEAVDRNGNHALTINYRVHTPAEVAVVSFNSHGYKHQVAKSLEQLPIVIACLTDAGYTVSNVRNTTFYVSK